VSDPDSGQTVKLQVEARSPSTAFTNTTTHASALLSIGSLGRVSPVFEKKLFLTPDGESQEGGHGQHRGGAGHGQKGSSLTVHLQAAARRLTLVAVNPIRSALAWLLFASVLFGHAMLLLTQEMAVPLHSSLDVSA
jgi:hypothetical protein